MEGDAPPTAVILHLFYPEMWPEIEGYLSNLESPFDLYVSIPESADFAADVITSRFVNAKISRCENRGRDIAPFLASFNSFAAGDYRYACKIHSKASPHLHNGNRWRLDMLEKLLGSVRVINRIKRAFDAHPDWGLIAPRGHVVPHRYYWERNAANVMALAGAADLPRRPPDFSFVAGSMFWFRPDALRVLRDPWIRAAGFEAESGQADGTLAHAFERFFGLAVQRAGYQIAESSADGVGLSEISFHFRDLVRLVCNEPEASGLGLGDAVGADSADPGQSDAPNGSGQVSIQALKDRHAGETAWIIGKGPSLLMLSKDQLGPGPVIAINEAITVVEQLGLDNPIYSMQKGADYYCRTDAEPDWAPRLVNNPLFIPLRTATLLVHARESPNRMKEYQPRYVFDNVVDFGLTWWDFSTLSSIAVARLLGCAKVVIVAHDAAMFGDSRTCLPKASGEFEVRMADADYPQHRPRIDAYLTQIGMPVDWYTPTSPDHRVYEQELVRLISTERDLVTVEREKADRLALDVAASNERTHSLDNEARRLDRELARLDREAARLTEALDREVAGARAVGQALAGSEGEVQRLRKEAEGRAAEISRLSVACADLQALQERTLADLGNVRVELGETQQMVQELSAELKDARYRLADLLQSASWRWTAPLRTAKRIVFRLEN